MADILIRGMEMPEYCGECYLVVFGWCCCLQKNVAYDSKPLNCPLIPLPEGHGRLIDADELCDGLVSNHPVVIYAKNAPTIIEADLEWKMKNCCCFSNTDQAEGGGEDG